MHEPDPENIYSIIGLTLVYLQSLERNIRFCTTFVLQGDAELNWHRLQNIEKDEGKKALGYFVGKVRERAMLHPSFDELITSVLRDRNDFVHNMDKIPGWSLNTPEGTDVALAYALSLIRRAHRVNEILAALLLQWQVQANIHVETTADQDAYFQEIDRRYGHLVGPLFGHHEA